jgi:hypothetical protein
MIKVGLPKLNSNIFATVELDTNQFTSQIALVVPVRKQGRYRGTVSLNGAISDTFSLAVLPSPAEAFAIIDLSKIPSADYNFNVVESAGKGNLVICVSDDTKGPRLVQIASDAELLVDNTQLIGPQQVILNLYRPGVHQVTDLTGKGQCTITVNQLLPSPPPWPRTPVSVTVTQPDPAKASTQMTPNNLTKSPLQPVVFTLPPGTASVPSIHLVTELLAITDVFRTELTQRGKARNFKL